MTKSLNSVAESTWFVWPTKRRVLRPVVRFHRRRSPSQNVCLFLSFTLHTTLNVKVSSHIAFLSINIQDAYIFKIIYTFPRRSKLSEYYHDRRRGDDRIVEQRGGEYVVRVAHKTSRPATGGQIPQTEITIPKCLSFSFFYPSYNTKCKSLLPHSFSFNKYTRCVHLPKLLIYYLRPPLSLP